MRTKKYIVYWDSCVVISYITNENRPNNEMDGVYDCVDRILRGEVLLIVLRNVLFEEVQLTRANGVAEKFSKLMMRKGIEIPSMDLRIERIAGELRSFYQGGPKKLPEKDSLHLATAIHYKADAFYTFDEGKKGGINLLAQSGNLAGHPLLICKPPVTQGRLLFFT